MKRYFHKLTAMLLAAAIAVPMVPPVTAYAADSLGGLKVTRENHDEDSALEYVYQFANVTVTTADMETMIIENEGGKVVQPTGDVANGFVTQDYSVNNEHFLCVSVPNDTKRIENYIKAVKFVNDTPDINSVRVLFVEGALAGNANANMGYWNGHYYEFISAASAITKLKGINAYKNNPNNLYWTTDTQINWEGARVAAEQYNFLGMQGYLATLVYKEEQEVVVSKLNKGSGGINDAINAAWIGGHYVGVGGPSGHMDPTFTALINGTEKTVKYGTIVTDASKYNAADYAPKKTAVETAATADANATNSEKNGWYWVTEPDGPIRFLAGIPKKDGSGKYLHHDTATEKAKGTYAIAYGLNVEHKDANGAVTIPAISYWTGDVVTTETGDAAANITDKLDYLRDEPNNASGGETTLTEHSMQVTAYNAWNDLPNSNTSPEGFFVEYSGTPQSDATNNITVVTAEVGAADISFNLNNATASITSGNEAAINTQTVVVTNAIGNNKVTKPGLTETTLTSTDASEFSGKWYKDAACTQEWNFEAGVDNTLAAAAANREIVLYAGWISNPKVVYDHDGDINGVTANENDVFAESTTVTIDPNGGTSGKYSVNYYDNANTDVTDADFSTDSNSLTTVTMNDSGDILTLGNPGKAHSTFIGWEKKDDNTTNKTVTYEAQWQDDPSVTFTDYDNSGNESTMYFPKNADVTFIMNGATTNGKYWYSSTSSEDITDNGKMDPFTYNDKIELDDPAKTNYVFKGWDLVLVEIVDDVPKYTFTAMWEAHPVATYDKYVNNTTNATPIDAAAFAANSVTVTFDLNEDQTETGETVDYGVTAKYQLGSSGNKVAIASDTELSLGLLDTLTLINADAGDDKIKRADGADFAGWTLADNGATATFTANWVEKGRVEYLAYDAGTQPPTEKGTLRIDRFKNPKIEINTNGGTYSIGNDQKTGTVELDVPASKYVGGDSSPYAVSLELNEPDHRMGYTFNGWLLSGTTFTAQWLDNPYVEYATAVYGTTDAEKDKVNENTAEVGDTITIDLNGVDATVAYTVGGGAPAAYTGPIVLATGAVVILDPVAGSGTQKAFLGWEKVNETATGYTLRAKWDTDALIAFDATEITSGGDGIPDKYQTVVIFDVVGGRLTDVNDARKVVTLKGGAGRWSEGGTASVDAPAVTGPQLGYKAEGATWKDQSDYVETVPFNVSKTNNAFIYKFVEAGSFAVTYKGTDREADNTLATASVTQPYGAKVLLIYGENDTVEVLVDAAKNIDVDMGKMPAGMEFFMGWVPVTSAPTGYEYALKATWDKDEIDAADNETTGGDDIPDSYQAIVTFKVVNGIFGIEGTVTEINDYVTLTTNNVWDKEGTATVQIPTEMTNAAGYNATGSWDNAAMNAEGATEVEVHAGDVLTYTFTRRSSSSSSTPIQKEEVLEDPDAMSGAPAPKIPAQLVEEHISYITGYEDGTVRPENKITRAEVATILYNLLTEEMKAEYTTHENDFTDVPEHMWFNMPISTLVDMMLLSGYDDGTFVPNKYITRAEMAAILARFQVDVPLKDDVALDDVDSSWAKDQIMLVARRGWINGYPDGTFRPNAHITRAETMAMINNMLHRNPQTLDDLHENVKYWEDNNKQSDWYYIHVQEATKTHTHDRNEHGFEIRG